MGGPPKERADPVVRPVALILITPVVLTLLATMPIELVSAVCVKSNGLTNEAPVLIEVAPVVATVKLAKVINELAPVPLNTKLVLVLVLWPMIMVLIVVVSAPVAILTFWEAVEAAVKRLKVAVPEV